MDPLLHARSRRGRIHRRLPPRFFTGYRAPRLPMTARYDIAVIGAGVFGAWTAYALHHAGKRVLLMDAYGPANSRASSGGETRITRMAYGDDELYSRWAFESLPEWRALEHRSRQKLFFETGVLTFSDAQTHWVQKSVDVIQKIGGEAELLSHDDCVR